MTVPALADDGFRRLVEDCIAAGDCSAVAAAFGTDRETAYRLVGGTTDRGPSAKSVTSRTLWDLASLTKVLATLPTVLRLVARNELGLDDALGDLVPVLVTSGVGNRTVRSLLAHTAGLPPGARDARPGDDPLEIVARSELAAARRVRYSDVGFVALGGAIEAVARRPLADVFALEIVEPLGLREVAFGRVDSSGAVVTADTVRNGVQLVHDPLARCVGGVAGHAGMFASLDTVCSLAMAWLDASERWLPWTLRCESWRCHSSGLPGGRRGLAWCLAGDDYHCVSDDWPATTVSHTGFTGTSIALEPVAGVWAVLLTNALPRAGDASAARRLRRAFHEAACSAKAAV